MDTSPDRKAVEWCEIRRWRGYARSTFYAITEAGEVLAESKPFRWADGTSTKAPAAEAAYDSVVGAISADGWTIADQAGLWWYERRFTRPRQIPVTTPSPQTPPAAPPAVSAAPAVPTPQTRERASTVPAAAAPGAKARRAPETSPKKPPKQRKGVLIGVAAGLVAVAVAAAIPSVLLSAAGSHSKHRHSATPRSDRDPVVADQHGRQHVAGAKEPKVRLHRHPLVSLRIVAHGNGSWLEIRRRSAGGPLLYEATLTDGGSLHFRGARLWARFGAAGNLSITADGRRVALSGTGQRVFAP